MATIASRAARDLLIGGEGADTLDGGPDEDLMIAGLTAHDDEEAALIAVLAEWTSEPDFTTRVSNLSGNGNGPRLNGTIFQRADDPDPLRVTVFDDTSIDVLVGRSSSPV